MFSSFPHDLILSLDAETTAKMAIARNVLSNNEDSRKKYTQMKNPQSMDKNQKQLKRNNSVNLC